MQTPTRSGSKRQTALPVRMAALRILQATDANPLFEPCLVRRKILDWLPQDDTFAFFTTCRSFQQTVLQHNQQAAATPELGLKARAVRPPPPCRRRLRRRSQPRRCR